MKKLVIVLLLGGFVAGVLGACTGGSGNTKVVYRQYYGAGGWRGYTDRRPIVVVPPDPGDKEAVNLPVYPDKGMPDVEATPLPVEPMPDIDMGMPDLFD